MTDENVTAQPADQSPGTPPAGEPLAKPDLKDAAKLDEDDLLRAVYRDVNKDESEGEQKPAVSDKDEAEPDKDVKRDASGKFVSKNPALPDDGKPAEKDAKEPTEKAAKVEAKPADKAEPDEKPAKKESPGHFRGWSKEHQEAFTKLPPEAQSLVLERQKASDGAFQRATQELAEYKKTAEPIVGAIKEHATYFDELSASLKTSPADIIKGLVATEQTLRFGSYAEKQRALMAMARDYGIPLQPVEADALADPTSPNSEHYAAFHDLKAQNDRLRAELSSVQRKTHQDESLKAAHSSFQQSVEQMSTATGEDGEPKYPDFNELRGVMASLIEKGEAETIHQAYAIAVAEKLKAARKAEDAAKAAEKAKRAGALNVTSSHMPVERFESEEDALRHAYRASMAS